MRRKNGGRPQEFDNGCRIRVGIDCASFFAMTNHHLPPGASAWRIWLHWALSVCLGFTLLQPCATSHLKQAPQPLVDSRCNTEVGKKKPRAEESNGRRWLTGYQAEPARPRRASFWILAVPTKAGPFASCWFTCKGTRRRDPFCSVARSGGTT